MTWNPPPAVKPSGHGSPCRRAPLAAFSSLLRRTAVPALPVLILLALVTVWLPANIVATSGLWPVPDAAAAFGHPAAGLAENRVGGQSLSDTRSRPAEPEITPTSHRAYPFGAGIQASGPPVAPSRGAGGRPTWLDDIERGTAFNKAHQFDYSVRELYLDKPGGGYVRLDAYDPVAGEIVSRKMTQFGRIQESTGIGYLKELANKYAPGARIADVPSSGPLAGQAIRGQQILEIPIQTKPVPTAVLSEAKRLKIVIRDVAGNIYR